MDGPETCHLRLAADGTVEACPRDECPFWEDGCLIERLGPPLLDRGPARYLVELRAQLDDARGAD